MKKTVFLLFMLSLGIMPVVLAQYPGSKVNHQSSSLYVESKDTPFWLFIDDVQQNRTPAHSIKVNNITLGEHYISLEIDDKDHTTIGRYVKIGWANNSYWLEKQRNLLGISPFYGAWGATVTMDWLSHNPNPVPAPAFIHSPTPMWMSAFDFQQALNRIKKETFEKDRMALAKQITRQNALSVEQVMSICRTFTFDKDRLEYAKFAYPSCVEKNKYYLVNDVFEFDSSKQELDKFVAGQQ
ncbi:MAG: DUF4476 domain-containing protein [Bacteroidales bacterium]|nr:DUF4476 domain-containing protein [Bacteroidales bacterium]